MSERTFKIHDVDVLSGKLKYKNKFMKVNKESIFESKTPSSAASKAFTRLCRLNKTKLATCSVDLSVIETTDGSNNKTYTYTFDRIYEPHTLKVGGQNVEYKYKIRQKSSKTR